MLKDSPDLPAVHARPDALDQFDSGLREGAMQDLGTFLFVLLQQRAGHTAGETADDLLPTKLARLHSPARYTTRPVFYGRGHAIQDSGLDERRTLGSRICRKCLDGNGLLESLRYFGNICTV